METENLLENSKKKLLSKNIDMICANSLTQSGAGFGVDTNMITIITKNEILPLPLLSKDDAANEILTHASTMI
jgi:phosphopantothenoylcysteine decarboxylase/phosphopantothenate--cysteine ligase